MKNIILLIITSSILSIKCIEPPAMASSAAVIAKLSSLLNQKEFFKLEKELNSDRLNISNNQRLYFQSFIGDAFNRNEASVNTIDTLLNNYSTSLTDSTKAALKLLQGDGYFNYFSMKKLLLTIVSYWIIIQNL